MTGFLGPDGAGKSTTMRLVLGLDRPTAGSVTVNAAATATPPPRCARSAPSWRPGRCTRRLAAEGRTVFVSSHVMSEMALTADHLVVIGRGRILADCSMPDFIAEHAASYVRVRSPQHGQVADLLRGAGAEVRPVDGELHVQGLGAAAVGESGRRSPRRPAGVRSSRGRRSS